MSKRGNFYSYQILRIQIRNDRISIHWESGILNSSETLVPSDSDNSEGVIQAAREFSNIILGNKSNATMASHNPWTTLSKQSFFDGQNIPITYLYILWKDAKR